MINRARWQSSHPNNVAVPVFKDNSTAGRTSLSTELKSPDSAGLWTADFAIEAGASYRIMAEAHVTDSSDVFNDAGVVVTWKKTVALETQIQREYIDPEISGGKLILFSSVLTAPENAKFAEIRLFVKWRKMKVEWRNIGIKKVKAQAPRPVRIVTTKVIPANSPSTVEENIRQAGALLERIRKEVKNPDLILFPENMLDRCVRSPLEEKGETIPGAFTKYLSAWARRLNCNIATTIHEKAKGRYHNTAFILDRKGRIAGKYRKVHLTLSEMETGILPGNEFTVFDLDFGKVGFTTCWDNWFCESSRILRLKGAEMILFPLAGDGDFNHLEHMWPTRAMDNGLPLVVSVWQGDPKRPVPSRIYDGTGKILAETTESLGYAEALVDLNKKHRTYWLSVGPSLGEGRSLYVRERRPEIYVKNMKDWAGTHGDLQ
ncbi:MAG TPA: hypothetical protein DCZ94_18770 [Lentisphaeria bacterium]|nr:MAG: hypothetical protein A2X48_22125 [Lentisphaerae bacterium GWF2_49_21]HBC88987.1 hypothetical protein [Lentisphaeria bacterium]